MQTQVTLNNVKQHNWVGSIHGPLTPAAKPAPSWVTQQNHNPQQSYRRFCGCWRGAVQEMAWSPRSENPWKRGLSQANGAFRFIIKRWSVEGEVCKEKGKCKASL